MNFLPQKTKYPVLLSSSFSLFLLALFFILSFPAFSQECYVTIPSGQTLTSYCAQEGEPNWNPSCAPQGNTCPGTTQSGGGGTSCWACVSSPTQTPESCTVTNANQVDCADLGYTITNDGQGLCSEPQVTCTGQRSDGCNYCVAPLCSSSTSCFNGDTQGDAADINCLPCSNITCSVDANATGETSGSANSSVLSGQSDGYDGVNWYLNNSLIGTTAMSADGTASNSFTSLQANTTYEVKAEYFDNQGGRPATSCTDPFTTGGTMTCSLTANNTTGTVTISNGDSVGWRLTSSPDGASAVWRGTNDGADIGSTTTVSPYPPSPWAATYTYGTAGTYTRYMEIKDSSGTVQCTTGTVSLYVNSPSCSSNPISVSPSSLSLSIGGSGQQVSASGTGGTVSWSSGNTSVATISPSFGTLTTVSPGTTAGTTAVTAADARSGGVTCRASASVNVVTSGTGCPGGAGACGDSNGLGITASCSGTWGWSGSDPTYSSQSTQLDSWCDGQTGGARPYCYICSTVTPSPSPSPSSGAISAGFTTGSIVVKGPLLLGRIFQDINASFSIDSPDKLIEKLTSIVSGKVQTTLGLLDITGRMQNVLAHGAAVYHMWTNNCAFGCSADDAAVQQEIIPAAGGASGSGASSFIKISDLTVCTSSSGTGAGCTQGSGFPGSYTKTTTYAQNPQQGFSAKLVQSASFTQGYRNNTNSAYTDILSYIPTNVESKPCATGCTVQSKIELDYSTRQNNRVVSSQLNPDGTCFLKEEACPPDSCSGSVYSLDIGVNQTYTLTRETYYQGESTTYSSNYYNNCTRYDIGRNERITPWSVSFTSPVVVSSGSLAINSWYNLFEIVTPESCRYDSGNNPQVSPPNPYCTCQLYSFNDGDAYAIFDCNFPLKSGRSFGDAPTGDYIFEVTASTGNPINYEISAGGTLARGSQSPSGGKLSIKFNVPDSSIGQRINVTLSQTGGNFEEVTFGPPALYPVGWYEANINFGRAATTSLDDARVIDPPDDYPYTIGMIPGSYCSKTSNLEQCYLTLTPSPLNSSNLNQVDFLLGNIKAGGWFQVKDADLHAIGSLISRVPSSCKTPKCTPSFDLSGPGGFPGVPAYTASSDFGSGSVSTKGWLARSAYLGRRYDYAYFRSLLGSVEPARVIDLNTAGKGTVSPDGILTLGKNDLLGLAGTDTANFAVYNGRMILADDSGTINLEQKKLVLFASGDVLIQSRINLRLGEGFFGLFGGASIVVDPSVKSENPNQYALEGVFLADGAIHTGTKNPIPNSGEADNQIYIRGMLAGWQGVILERDLDPLRQTGANNDKPAEFIEYAPDLVLNLPKELLRQGSVWREIAP